MNLFIKLDDMLLSKEEELKNDKKKSNLGLNIDNLINTESFNISIMKAKIDMYKTYIDTFNNHHIKYYTRLLLKCKLHMGIVNEDIIINTINEKSNKIIDEKSIFISKDEEMTIKSLTNFDKDSSINTKSTLDNIILNASSSDSSLDKIDNNSDKE